MTIKTKMVLINASILAGLLLELYWGRPLVVIGASAIILFGVANMALLGKKHYSKRGTDT